ncbi:NAD(P)/FAD-dependent oxidoreductase [Anaerococcus sp. AGMB00486]|uniref:NAD(P)/FAD-dependent oxidoreductase n=2 Tax=Anaerococcus TaxID=165779 RepID=A0ABX2NBK6_9FIRM|nr:MULTISPECIES: NAD(P)/FAD-dependent oxidoreductase [Anaerococcus]MDY3006660.1 NAD(P)/FAD-dependent oxidoreductase [Anaerococcus porci]MSS78127.1 NAD(P)/FAD-dependent oxidoreductase [Anaerococcus porci]NVF12069.1 NAD(P)/FAD-dependent oxidoreductase [Anaerococcus faecalis]
MYDLIIIGAGVSGASIARRLSRYKLKILVLEKEIDVSMGASKANSAIVHGGYAESHDELRGRICYPGRVQFKELNKELNFGFLENGSLVLAFNQEGEKILEKLYKMGIRNGLDDLEIIGKEKLRELEPNVSDEAISALYCKGAGVCSPYEYVIALMENAIENKTELKLQSEVVDIKKENNTFKLKTKDGKSYKGHFVINASGLNGAKVSSMITKTDFDIHPRSGEYLIMQKGTGDRIKQVLFQTPSPKSKGILVTRTYHNNLLLGPDAIDEEEIDLGTHIERLVEIYKLSQKSVKKDVIDLKEFIRSFTGLRPASSTGDFIIENTETDGFINVVGIQSPGITSSPEIAKIVEEILKDLGLELEDDPDYNPYRKPIIEYKELEDFNKVKEKIDLPLGEDERLVCRCEQVKESTIRDAMNRGIPTLSFDAIKRRTRCGMGFCQGSFCRNRVIEVMEDESGEKINSNKFDTEHSGITRVNKKDINEFIKKSEKKED